jgi:hypothetical protein
MSRLETLAAKTSMTSTAAAAGFFGGAIKDVFYEPAQALVTSPLEHFTRFTRTKVQMLTVSYEPAQALVTNTLCC